MRKTLPPDIARYVKRVIRRTDWDAIAAQSGNLCAGCPWHSHEPSDPEETPPCADCPLWGYRVSLAELRLLRRLERGGGN